jgi:glycosyltransferase involved in cell wall biosynthesis
MSVYFLSGGDINSLTGGHLYNMHIINGLKNKNYSVSLQAAGGKWDNKEGIDKMCRLYLQKIPWGSCIIIDSLILASLTNLVRKSMDRFKFLGLIHLPVSYDIKTGIHGKLSEDELGALNHMHRLVVTGGFTFDLLCNAGIDPRKITIIQPGTDQFPRKAQYARVPSNLLCIANYSALKAQDVLIRALSRLKTRNWTLHLYGDTDRDPEYTSFLRSLILYLGLESRIIVHRIVERQNISKVFLEADLFILPSLFESYGMVLSESLAHGIPVISTLAGNIRNTVPEGMGILIEPGNEAELADSISSLFDSPEKYSALCTASSSYYKQSRSWEQAVSEFESVIRKI